MKKVDPYKSDRPRVGIIGLGKMGILHAALVNINPEAELRAFYEPNKQLLNYLKNFCLKAHFFSDLDQMLEQTTLDTVFICTPNATHLPLALKFREKNLNIFVEMPLAESYNSAKKMIEMATRNGFVHAVGYHFSHKVVFQEAKRLIDNRVLKKILRFRASLYVSILSGKKKGWIFDKSQSGGGVVINTASHLLYLLYWLFGPVKSLLAKTSSKFMEVEDSASLILEFSSGIIGLVDVSWSRPGFPLPVSTIFIEGTQGTMEITNDSVRLYLYKETPEFKKKWTTIHRADLPATSKFYLGEEGFYEENSSFIQCCKGKQLPKVSWKEGLEVLRIVEAAYLSSQTKSLVKLDEVK